MALRYAAVSNFKKSVKNLSALLSISSPSFFQFSTFHRFRSTGFDPEDNNKIPALGRDLMCNNNLMIMVEETVDEGANKFSVLSAQDNSFKPLQSGNRLPNLCRLTTGKRRILATCNTWMLCHDFDCEDEDVCKFLWEPATDELKTVVSYFDEETSPPGVTFASYIGSGVGFDPVSGDYKVVKIMKLVYGEDDSYCWYGPTEIIALVLLKKTGLWKKVVFPHGPDVNAYTTSSIHINSFCYWIVSGNPDLAIIPFDCVKDEFPASLIPVPGSLKETGRRDINLAEFHGSLAAIVYDRIEIYKRDISSFEFKHRFGFQIWVWKDGSWSLELTFHIPVAAGVVKVLGFFKNEIVILISFTGELLLYNIVTKDLEKLYNIVTKDLENLGISGASPCSVKVYPFYS